MIEDGYSYCSNQWALDKRIKNELGLLLIISSLCAKEGYCFADNKYLADLFGVDEVSISRKIRKLVDLGYLNVTYKKRGAEILERHLRLTKMLTDDYQNCQPTISKNAKDNNINFKNINFKNNTAQQKKNVDKSGDNSEYYPESILIGKDFKIFFNDEHFYPYHGAPRELVLSVERWLIANKLGEVVDKSFICRQIGKFAKRQGCYDELLGLEEGQDD